MNLPVAIDDPNADLELWLKHADRDIVNKMYILMFQQAKMAMAEVERLSVQLENERGLPDKYREGMYTIVMVNGKREPYYMCSHDTVRTWLIDPARHLEEIKQFLEDSVL